MEESIKLQDIVKIVKKRIFLIVSLPVLAVIIAAIISYFVLTPVYQASTQILVNQQKTATETIQSQDIQTNLQLINTYNVIIKSPVTLNQVIERLDLEISTSQLSEKITVSNVDNSQIITINVMDEQQFKAVDIANTVVEVFQEEIPVLMNVNNVNVLSPAVYSEDSTHVKPNELMLIAIAAVIGILLGVGVAFLLEYLDTTIKTERDVEELLGLPILGMVIQIPKKGSIQETKEVEVQLSRRKSSKKRSEKLV
ncbi:YveK family protein [Ureibacillus aquaedulcis]|uniref:Wzz/FepE/Etk N-terminal domain-containing protein n=1 Tax=Ureibacillus aquaedulcis TaxID=3058421 RepID=A0ABT8GUM2_9BACL|nr:Wzz/FepE/Etk N-terminal domain-containing protein [Ureibacillus sp. BA0131]MDN4495113.1 Wzz/FepE/Etk N-terminal domain-containing protein [Ureibacillus sp. BA0131]